MNKTPHAVDRLPPHSIESEQGALGCALIDPGDALPRLIAKFPDKNAFYDLRHQTLFSELRAMVQSGTPVDLITVQQRLKDAGTLDEVGGLVYLSGLQDAVPSSAHLDYYLEVLIEKDKLRRVIRACGDVARRAQGSECDIPALLSRLESELMSLSQERQSDEPKPLGECITMAIDEMESRAKGKAGVPTGFPTLDRCTGGLLPGELWVVAARPAVGKTSLAMNIAEHVAGSGNNVLVFSLEMSCAGLAERMLGAHAEVKTRRRHAFDPAEQARLVQVAKRLSKLPVYIDDGVGGITAIRAKARRHARKFNTKLIVADYLQLIPSEGRDKDRRVQIEAVSRGLKLLAKELGAPLIAVSQLNRSLETGKPRKPQMSDIREAGGIEQDADGILFIYTEKQEDEDDPTVDESLEKPVLVRIGKSRNGPSNVDIRMTFHTSKTRFVESPRIPIGPND